MSGQLDSFCWQSLTKAWSFAAMPSFIMLQWCSSSTESLLRVDIDQLSALLAMESEMVTHWCVRKDRSFSNTRFSVILSIGFIFSIILIKYSKVYLVPYNSLGHKWFFMYFKVRRDTSRLLQSFFRSYM